MSSAGRRTDTEEYQRANALLARTRDTVAGQLHDLVIERQGLGSPGEFVEMVRQIGRVQQEVIQSRGRQQQARELGLPLSGPIESEREALTMLRQSIMSACAAGAQWVVAMDVDASRGELEPGNGRRRRRPGDEDI